MPGGLYRHWRSGAPTGSASVTVAVPQTSEDPVTVRGLTPSAGGVFRVYVGDASLPVQGRYEAWPGGVRFRPFFPFDPASRTASRW